MRFLWPALLAFLCAAATAEPSQQPFFNVVTLEASASAEIPTDTLTITLFTEEQGPDATQLAAKVNARLDQALAQAKNVAGVEARSGNYQTNALYDRANQITGWRTRAEITLQSRDFKAAGALAGRLQPAMKLSAMTFSLSREAREKAEGELLTEALGKYQRKAETIARALGFPGYVLGQITVRNDGLIPPPPIAYRGMAAAMADGASAPPIPTEGGKNTVTVTVSGSVILGPGK
jgi:predicted secreted protein